MPTIILIGSMELPEHSFLHRLPDVVRRIAKEVTDIVHEELDKLRCEIETELDKKEPDPEKLVDRVAAVALLLGVSGNCTAGIEALFHEYGAPNAQDAATSLAFLDEKNVVAVAVETLTTLDNIEVARAETKTETESEAATRFQKLFGQSGGEA